MKNSYDERLKDKIEEEKKRRDDIEKEGKRNIEPNLKNISDATDIYYFYNKLRVYCGFLSYSTIIKKEKMPYTKDELFLMEHILTAVEQKKVQSAGVTIFLKIARIFEDIDGLETTLLSLFDETMALLEVNDSQLSVQELLEAYSLLGNFCIYKTNHNPSSQGNIERSFAINNKIINLNNRKGYVIPTNLFENIIIGALRIGNNAVFQQTETSGIKPDNPQLGFKNAIEWAGKFCKGYKKRLDENGRKYHYPYCEALIYFNQQDFKKVHKLLKDHQARGMFIGLSIKILYLKNLYELYTSTRHLNTRQVVTERDLINGSEALRALVRYEESTKQLMAYHKNFYETFEKMFRKLFNFYKKYDGIYKRGDVKYQREKAAFEKKLNQLDFVYKNWFLEKLKEIK